MNQPVAVPEVLSTDLPAGAFLLDVREDDEWSAGHAPDAVHVRLGELGARAAELPRDREVYVICRTGNRSAYAAQALVGGGLDEPEPAVLNDRDDGPRDRGVVQGVRQVVVPGGRPHVGRQVDAEDERLGDVAFPVVHADDRGDGQAPDRYVVHLGTPGPAATRRKARRRPH